ncbi:hypothetical protein MMC26_000579 [Xylographa opegraphella]|nr:hypothetical protein [Xylographa opegraphella]
MAAVHPSILMPRIEVQDQPLPSAISSRKQAPAESIRYLNSGTTKLNNITGVRRSRERPVRPSRRTAALANPLQSTPQLDSTPGINLPKSVQHVTISNDESWKERWQELDLPDELLQVPGGTEQEICAIIKESFYQSRAIRASLLDSNRQQSQLDETNIDRKIPYRKPELRTHDFSVTSSPRTESNQSSATASSCESHRHSAGAQSFESFTSAELISHLPLTPYIAPLSPDVCVYKPDPEKNTRRRGLISKLLRGKELKVKPVTIRSSTNVLEVTAATKECASCFDDVPSKDAVGLACQHSYCSPCFTQLVTTAMRHENFWPPKCCLQDIPKRTLEINLSAQELVNYRLKAREYAIPDGERCYTCGLRWRTCVCTEEDQVRRRDELATRRAIVNAEEAEVEAAIEAVAEAERREIEEAIEQERRQREIVEREERARASAEEARLAEEMQRLERLEAARVEAINSHYEVLRTSLNKIHQMQRKAISARHNAEMSSTQHELEEIASQEMALLDEQNKVKSTWKERIQKARLKNAREVIETATRHRVDQDRYLLKLTESSKDEACDDITEAHMIDELAIIQESEREALRIKHQREIQKLQARAAGARLIGRTAQQSTLQQEKQMATQAIEQLAVRMYSDSKWLELVTRDRATMLAENEHQLLSSGADISLSTETSSDCSEGDFELDS